MQYIFIEYKNMRILVLSATGVPEANLESARYFIENKSSIDKITILSSEYMNKEGKTKLLVQSLQNIQDIEVEILDIKQGHEDFQWTIIAAGNMPDGKGNAYVIDLIEAK